MALKTTRYDNNQN